MEPAKWEQVKEIFDAALQRSSDERARFLADECGDDEELRREVESLLFSIESADSFMQKPIAAAGVIAESVAGIYRGQRISHYEIIEKIGTGGMGEIYLAKDTILKRQVALKLLAPHVSFDQERIGRFRQEAFATSALNHPNIITIYEIGKWENRDFIAAEYIEGETLRALLGKRKVSSAEAVDTLMQIASAIAAAHSAGIVHRDIKPENVMIRRDGLVKVLDFGIAKYRPAEESPDSLVETGIGEVIGTAAYMSPEQARGLEVDARTDVWSLGVILYEMIARKLPFPGDTRSDRIAAILEREPAPLAKICRKAPAGLDKIIERALAKDKKRRYQNVAEMAEDLRRIRETIGEKCPAAFAFPARRSPAVKRFLPAALVGILLISLIAAAVYYLTPAKNAVPNEKRSIAVLPFVNESGSADIEYLSDGISESLINDLSRLRELKVIARATAFAYKNRRTDPRQAGRELGVDTVLIGKVTQLGETLIVQADLIDVAEGSQIWGERYMRKLDDLISVQENISREILKRLQPRLSGDLNRHLAEMYPENSQAFQLYLKGRYFWNRRTEADIRRAIGYFEQTIAEDPEFALAYVGLADCFNVMGFYSMIAPNESFPKAKTAAMKALELNGEMAEAHNSLAYAALYYDWDFAAAEKGFRRAIELKPNYPIAHQWYGNLLTAMGRWDEAVEQFRRAQSLDPLSPVITAVPAWTYLYARQYDLAAEPCLKALELDRNFALAHFWLGQAYERKGIYDKAVAELEIAAELSENSPEMLALLAHAHAVSGNVQKARPILSRLIDLSKQRYVSPYHIAVIYAGLGDRAEALKLLETSYRDRQNVLVFMKFDSRLDVLRSDPVFRRLQEKIFSETSQS